MIDFLVALAGTPEADTADFVCDGTSDDVEIGAAIAAAAAAGGGTIHLAAGTYATSRPITVLDDNIHLQGAGAGLTTVQPASDWRSELHPNGAHLLGVITFCAVDDFSVRGITVDAATNDILCNGIVAIPDGTDGAGTICTNGIIANNAVFLIQAHDYSIWSQRSERIEISNNLVDGGSTIANSSPYQEGIEIYGGNIVTIIGNTVKNIGGAGFNIGGVSAVTPDCSVTDLVLSDNVVESSRIGISLGTTADPVSATTADLRDITISGNELRGITEYGISARNWTGNADNPPVVSALTIADNTVTMSVVPADAGPLSASLQFFNGGGRGTTQFSNINITGNTFSEIAIDEVYPFFYLPARNYVNAFVYGYENVTFSGNHFLSPDPRTGSVAVAIQQSHNFHVDGNTFDGAGISLVYAYETSGFTFEANSFLNWDAGSLSSIALLLENSADTAVLDNSFSTSYTAASPSPFLVHPTEGLIARNFYLSDRDVILRDNVIEGVHLVGSASVAIGNALGNQIFGNSFDNFLEGRNGDDMLSGGAGADRLDGGDGFDWARYDSTASAVAVDLLNPGSNTGEAAGDTFISIEGLAGSAFNDSLQGNDAANALTGLAGNDYLDGRAGDDVLRGGEGIDHLVGGAGSDVLDGGSGYDYARYHTAAAGVVVDLVSPLLNAGDAAGDSFISIEGLVGSAFNDTLRGDASGNDLVALEGNDIVEGREGNDGLHGGAGADRLDGGEGFDLARYDTSAAGVTVDLVFSDSNNGDAAGDVFVSIEGLAGSAFNDTLRGSDAGNELLGMNGNDVLEGRAGDDVLQGGEGIDHLVGGAGSDVLDGGSGYDYARYHTAAAGVVVDLVSPLLNAGDAAGDSFISIEGLVGSAFNDTLRGDASGNDLVALEGNDIVEGREGNDGLHGGAGADRLDGGEGFDLARYDTSAAGVTVDLVFSDSNNGDAAGDVFVSIEGLAGSAFNDTLRGSDAGNELLGMNGNDVLEGRAGNDVLEGRAGDDVLSGGAGADRLDGGDGFDWARYDSTASAVAVDLLNPGSNTGEAAGDTFISIEGLAGSAFNDSLQGNDAANALTGLAGNDYLDGRAGDDVLRGGEGIDHLVGGAGSDVLDGGSGYDYARYHTAAAGVVVDLVSPLLNAGDAAGDSFISIEGLVGSAFNDTLRGDASGNDLVALEGNDIVEGREGNDGLHGGAGADRLDGGEGFDLARYDTSAAGVTVDLVFSDSNNGDAAGDVFVSIEGLAGSAFNDTLRGSDAGNELLGMNGNDVLEGRAGDDVLQGGEGIDHLVGGAGSDVLDGGSGYDYARYHTAAAGVVVDLVSPLLNAGDAAGDSFISIEGLVGSAFNDTLRGDASGNDLVALEGNDIVEGREGNDGLHGGAGADRLDGGEGFDLARYDTSAAGVTVDLVFSDSNNGDAAGDVFVSIEGLAGSAFNDTLRGSDAGNELLGMNGNDVLEGRAGDDVLSGGAGADRLDGGMGADYLVGGLGGDAFVFSTTAAPDNIDFVADFESGTDHVQLVASGSFAGMPIGSLAEGALHISGRINGMTQDTRIVYDPATGALYFDGDGSGAQTALQFAVLVTRPSTLQATDFTVTVA